MTSQMKDDWNEWRNHVLLTIKASTEAQEALIERFEAIRADVISLKVKAGIWGLLGGLIPAMGVIMVEILLSLLKRP